MPNFTNRKKRKREHEIVLKKNGYEERRGETAFSSVRELSLVKFLNQIFSENKSHAHRVAAVQVLGEELSNMPEEEVHSQALNWIGHLVKAIEACKVTCAAELALCCHSLSQLLVLCSSSAELSRNISHSIVPKLLPSLLEIDSAEQDTALIAAVHLMKICLKYFGGSCLSFKNKMETYLMQVALAETLSPDSLLLKMCLSALSSLPNCGGQGPTGNKHSEMWSNQLCRMLDAIDQLLDYLYSVCGRVSRDAPKVETSGQPFPTVSGDTSISGLTKAARYLFVYLKAVRVMIDTPFPWRVRIPVKHLLSTICNLTSVSPDSVIFKKRATRPDLEVVLSHLSSLHCAAIDLLVTMGNLCGSCLYPYTTTICQLLSSQLYWTRAMLSREESYVKSRVNTLNAVYGLLSQPGLSSILSTMAGSLVEHSLGDLTLTEASQADLMQLSSSASKRSRKAPPISFVAASNISRKLAALRLIGQLLCFHSGSLSTKLMKMLYDSLIALTIRVQSPSATDCYAKDAQLREAVYEALLSSIHSYNREVGPLTHIATQLLRNGLGDRSPEIRSLCNKGLLVCQLAVEPRAPPLVQHSSAYFPEPLERENGSKEGEEEQYSQPTTKQATVSTSDVAIGKMLTDISEPVVKAPGNMSDTDCSNDSIVVHVADSRVVSSAPSPEVTEAGLSGKATPECSTSSASLLPVGSSPCRTPTPSPGTADVAVSSISSLPSAVASCDSSVSPTKTPTVNPDSDLLKPAVSPQDIASDSAAMDTESGEVVLAPLQQTDEEPVSADLVDMMNTFVTDGPDE